MSHRETVQCLTQHMPPGHEPIHQSEEMFVVRRLKQVNHLVDDNILKTILRFFSEVGIQSDCARAVITAPPLRFHSLDEQSLYLNAYRPLPLCN
jgi:hypothetical protein